MAFLPAMGVARLQKGDGLQPYLAFVLLHRVLTMNIINISHASNHKALLAAKGRSWEANKNALRKGYTI